MDLGGGKSYLACDVWTKLAGPGRALRLVQGLASVRTWAKSGPTLASINKILLEHSHGQVHRPSCDSSYQKRLHVLLLLLIH